MEAESILGKRTARVLGALALFAAVGGLLVWYIAPSGSAEKQALVVTLAQILGGTALLSGLYFTWRTLQVNREGQITDRFTRAIDQLGKVEDGKKLFEIRVGGIYALERIARESKEDYWPIIEILTAYVRQNAPRPEEGQEDAEDAKALDPDIQAIMTVLRRRSHYYAPGKPESLDLHEANLSGADLSGANLQMANLSGVDLSGALLIRANLSLAGLADAHLNGARLGDAYLTRAHLAGAYLNGANLSGVNFSGADLSGADLSGVYFPEGSEVVSYTMGLTQEQLEETHGDENTQLPSHLRPPENWSVKTDEQTEEG